MQIKIKFRKETLDKMRNMQHFNTISNFKRFRLTTFRKIEYKKLRMWNFEDVQRRFFFNLAI